MNRLLQWLTGLEPSAWENSDALALEFLALPSGDHTFWAFHFGIAGVVLLWFLYRREWKGLSQKTRLLLWTLRLSVFLGLVFMLLQPVLVFSRREYIPSYLPVLLDSSESMSLQDAYVDEKTAHTFAESLHLDGGLKALREQTRMDLAHHAVQTNWIKRLEGEGERKVEVYQFDEEVSPVAPGTLSQIDAAGAATRLGSALRNLLLRYKGTPLAGLLVITDGQLNAGEPIDSVVAMANAESIPIYTLAMGTPEGPRNVSISAIETSPAVFVRDPIEITTIIESRGMDQEEVELLIECRRNGGPWQELTRQSVLLEKDQPQQRLVFQHEERAPMRLDIRAEIQGVSSELRQDDNIGTARIRVVRQKIRVLFIAGNTFPEVQFLRNALLRDDGVLMSSWLMTATEDYEHPGDRPIKRLPVTQEEIDDYDVVILYDPDPNAWLPNFSELLERFVARAGGGLIYVAGEQMSKASFDKAGDPSVQWLKLLPVVREPGLFQSEVAMRLSAREPWRLDITPAGEQDPIFRFEEDTRRNRDILANLPGMFWHLPVTRAKSGASVLAHHGDPRMRNQFGQHVLLATHLYGPGRTFFVGFDSTYRWRYLDEKHFDLFWARMVDRAGRNKQLGGRFPFTLKTDRVSYQPGDQVLLSARFTYPDDVDSGLTSMRGEWEVGDQSPKPITLEQHADDPTLFQASFKAAQAGTYFLRAWSGAMGAAEATRAATMEIDVAPANVEFKALTQNRLICERLAEQTGGRVFNLAELDAVPNAFNLGKVERVLEERREFWDAPLVFGLVMFCIIAEWIIRKIVRLV